MRFSKLIQLMLKNGGGQRKGEGGDRGQEWLDITDSNGGKFEQTLELVMDRKPIAAVHGYKESDITEQQHLTQLKSRILLHTELKKKMERQFHHETFFSLNL